MGANAVTTVPLYASGDVLTASNLNITNSGIPVFATTVTRDAAFGGTGEKVLAEGQFAYIEATNTTQYYDGAAWVAVGASGLTLVTAQTIGSAVGSVTVTNAFSATYDAYRIIVTGGTSSAAAVGLSLKLGASTTTYNWQLVYGSYNATPAAAGSTTDTAFLNVGLADSNYLAANIEVENPFLAKYTTICGKLPASTIAGMTVGVHKTASSYTDFTLTPASGTLTGGTVRVYGYANS